MTTDKQGKPAHELVQYLMTQQYRCLQKTGRMDLQQTSMFSGYHTTRWTDANNRYQSQRKFAGLETDRKNRWTSTLLYTWSKD